jgi:hypothetical protein
MRAAGADMEETQTELGHRSAMVTLSIHTRLFEDAFESVMDRLDTDRRELVRPKSGPNVVELYSKAGNKPLTRGFRHLEGCPSGLRRRS